MNRWAIEISSYHIDFQDIKGIKNTLADPMSQLIEIDPETELDAKPYGYEYGCYMFEDPSNLQAVSVSVNEIVEDSKVTSQSENTVNRQDQALLLTKIEELIKQQQKDKFCANILHKLKKGCFISEKLYFLKEGVLY